MKQHFQLLPSDLLLDIASYLNLSDTLNYPLISSSFWNLGQFRSLWLGILKRTQKHHPLACPVATDIDQLGRDELCRIAHRTNRIDQFWDATQPVGSLSTAQPTKTLTIALDLSEEEEVDVISSISGTTLVILYAFSGRLFCCDVRAGPRLNETRALCRGGDLRGWQGFENAGNISARSPK
ncbi:hypothetical protein FPV67DRAFT_741055 [Lyophyllum atratum]|nr:hypothetical protein FPV67DRAFT_741055 [Lyophyllum atratum]